MAKNAKRTFCSNHFYFRNFWLNEIKENLIKLNKFLQKFISDGAWNIAFETFAIPDEIPKTY